MFFNRRQEPQEFRSEMPEYDEDQDEYYGEEDDGDAGDDDDDYEDDDEGGDEDGAKPAKNGGGNAVRVALMALAGVGVVGLGGYYAATLLAPEAMNEIVNSYFGGDGTEAAAPAAPPPGEAAPPPPGDTKPVEQAAAPGDKPAGKPAEPPADKPADKPAEGQPEGAEAPKPLPRKFKVPTPDPEVLKPSQPGEDGWVQPEAVVAPKPPVKAAKKARPQVAAGTAPSKWAQRQAHLRKVRAQRLAAYRKRHGRGSYAQGRHSKASRTWHARYQAAPAYSRGTGWISGQSAYIPWGGGQAGAAHHPRAASHRHAAARGRYGVQVGSFANPGNAQSLVSQLRSQGIPAYVGHGVGMTRVYVGAYKNRYAAAAAMRSLQTQGIPAAVTAH
ncbi:MAG: SPOR domain-containing protein [Candidatus Sericytochromatia bacterium]|nr:SPOR domain-containing protein [Candidatus Sericytochromatia bacterium]